MINFKEFCILEEASRSNIDLVIDAIKRRVYISFKYDHDGNKEPYRSVRPAAFGYSSKGNPLLRAYVMNPTEAGLSKKKNNWRLFNTEKMDDVVLSTKKFKHPGKGYNPSGDRAIPNLKVKF